VRASNTSLILNVCSNMIGCIVNVCCNVIGRICVQVPSPRTRREARLVVTMRLHRVRIRRKGPAARAARGRASFGVA
jgi:hypothetical protein